MELEKLYVIYKATNKANNKSYIGFTSNLSNRRGKHEWHAEKDPVTPFQYAIREHGKELFEWEVLYESYDKDHTHLVMEEFFIRKFNTHAGDGYGYNHNYGGRGAGRVITQQARENHAAGQLGKKQSQETIDKRVNKLKGKKRTPEFCKRVSEINTGKKHSDISRGNISNGHKKKIEIDGVVYLGLVEAAEKIGIGASTLKRWLKSGKLKRTNIHVS